MLPKHFVLVKEKSEKSDIKYNGKKFFTFFQETHHSKKNGVARLDPWEIFVYYFQNSHFILVRLVKYS